MFSHFILIIFSFYFQMFSARDFSIQDESTETKNDPAARDRKNRPVNHVQPV